MRPKYLDAGIARPASEWKVILAEFVLKGNGVEV